MEKEDIYDTEQHCEKCGARLYVSAIGSTIIRNSLQRTGLAGLVCICGHLLYIGTDFKPRPGPQKPKKMNDEP